jgi:hypothetical protein
MSDTATLTGQDIGQAARATRAVLDALLADSEAEIGSEAAFHQWVALNVLGTAGSPVEQARLVQQMTYTLKVAEPAILAAVEAVVSQGLVAATGDPVRLALTGAGETRFQTISDGIGQIARRLYGDLPPEDLSTTHRVLGIVTERANAALASR